MTKKDKKAKKEMKRLMAAMRDKAKVDIFTKTTAGLCVAGIGNNFGLDALTDGQELSKPSSAVRLKLTDLYNIAADDSFNGDTLIIPAPIKRMEDILHGKSKLKDTAESIALSHTFIDLLFENTAAVDKIITVANNKIANDNATGILIYLPYVPSKNRPGVYINILYIFLPESEESNESDNIYKDLYKYYGKLFGFEDAKDTDATKDKNNMMSADLIFGMINKLGIKSLLVDFDSFIPFINADSTKNKYEIYNECVLSAVKALDLFNDEDENGATLTVINNDETAVPKFILITKSIEYAYRLLKADKTNKK